MENKAQDVDCTDYEKASHYLIHIAYQACIVYLIPVFNRHDLEYGKEGICDIIEVLSVRHIFPIRQS